MSSRHVAGVVLGKSRVLNLIVLSSVMQKDEEKLA